MSESVVDVADVEETVTRVLTHFVQVGDEQDEMSVEFLQKQMELHLEYVGGTLSKWKKWQEEWGVPEAQFFFLIEFFTFTFSLTHDQPYATESMTGSIGQRLLT